MLHSIIMPYDALKDDDDIHEQEILLGMELRGSVVTKIRVTKEEGGNMIIQRLKVIFMESSRYVVGGAIGTSKQPINKTMMNLYQFHQFKAKLPLRITRKELNSVATQLQQ